MKELVRRVLLALLIFASTAYADSYPSKPIKIIVPWPAGGIVDARTRLIADRLSRSLKEQVIVENKPGASATIGAQMVAQATPDGYTLLSGTVVEQTTAPLLFRELGYVPQRDFVPIAMLGRACLTLYVHPKVEARSFDEFVKLIKSNAGKYSYATAGVGSPHHLLMETVKQRLDLKLNHIPYKGAAPALQDLVAGHVPVMFEFPATTLGYARAGKIRPLASACENRPDVQPDVPTFAELGYPDLSLSGWGGFFAPRGTPRAIVQRLNAEINKIVMQPDIRSHVSMAGAEPMAMTPEQFAAFIEADRPRQAAAVKAAGIEPQ